MTSASLSLLLTPYSLLTHTQMLTHLLISFLKEEKKGDESSEEEEVEEEEDDDEEENPRNSIFERVAASVRSLSFR